MKKETEYTPALHGLLSRVEWNGRVKIPDITKPDWLASTELNGFYEIPNFLAVIKDENSASKVNYIFLDSEDEDIKGLEILTLVPSDILPGFFFLDKSDSSNCPEWMLNFYKPISRPAPDELDSEDDETSESISLLDHLKKSRENEFYAQLEIVDQSLRRLIKENEELKLKLASDRYLNTDVNAVNQMRHVLASWWPGYDLSKGVVVSIDDLCKTTFQAGNLVQTLFNGPDGFCLVKLDGEEIKEASNMDYFTFIVYVDREDYRKITISSPMKLTYNPF